MERYIVGRSKNGFHAPVRNAEGYADPTAHNAMENILNEQKETDSRCNRLISVIKDTISLAGFELIARIEIRDKATGKEYK